MAFPTLPNTLRHGVGRRILVLFLLAGILPVTFTAGLAYLEVARGLEQEVNKSLRASAKEYSFDLLDRLQRTSDEADEVVRMFKRHGADALAEHQHILNAFESISYIDAAGQATIIHGNIESHFDPVKFVDPVVAAADVRLLFTRDNDVGVLTLLRPVGRGQQQSSMLVFRVLTERTWGIEEHLAFGTDYCVFLPSGDQIHCTREIDHGIHAAVATTAAVGQKFPAAWQQDGQDYLAAAWQLFLTGEFGAPSLDIIAIQSKSYALQSSADFRRIFVPALLLVVIFVGVLSFSLIGKSLVPLQQLSNAVRQISDGNLESRVRIRSNDEFEWLGEAFNDMADRLGQQISALEAMSEIDRLILSGAKFEDVTETVIEYLDEMTNCAAIAVIARDTDTPHWAKMISCCDQEFKHERISLPMEMAHRWCQPRQVLLDDSILAEAPYKETFLGYGVKYVVLIPVVLNDDLKGMLLLGSTSRFNMQQGNLLQCIDLAGRFAVALASVEREEVLYRQAHFDELTGLPNRQLLKDRLEQQVIHARREGCNGAMLFLDLDRFKEINDVFGHSVGDLVLTQAAQRIIGEIRDSDTVARLGGDEFVIILPRVHNDSTVRVLAARLLARLSESFTVRGNDHYVGASMGIVMFPDDGDSVETLLKNADAAMYRAKDSGRGRFEFFSKKLNAESRRKIGLERDLRVAFNDNKLEVYYQPQFDISTGVISGAEALLRWEHEVEGCIAPSEFVPLAEDSSLIIDIGRWVVDQTCRDLRVILDMGLHPGAVSINVSTRQLRDPDFVGDVLAALHRNQIHPGYLELEVTETAVAQNRDTATKILEALRAEGVRVAIDDFGTGYSSLSYLQQMPFDLIKIDKSFIDRIGADEPSNNICRTVIRMAHDMGRKAIAEGVETRVQVDFLLEHGCDFVQGFFYSEALPHAEFIKFIEKQDFHTLRRKALEIA